MATGWQGVQPSVSQCFFANSQCFPVFLKPISQCFPVFFVTKNWCVFLCFTKTNFTLFSAIYNTGQQNRRKNLARRRKFPILKIFLCWKLLAHLFCSVNLQKTARNTVKPAKKGHFGYFLTPPQWGICIEQGSFRIH